MGAGPLNGKNLAQSIRYCLGACVITDADRYTSVAEGMDPASMVDFINRYLEVLFRPVFDHGGFVSDVKGDGMLAVWTDAASSRELRARVCRACLEMAEAAARFDRSLPGRGLATRIGAYFGPLALATVGAFTHYEYRAVGDTVNTSSRLEELNKELGTRVLISASLAEGLDEFLFRDLGEFRLRGKRNRVRALELVGWRDAASARERRLCDEFAAALAAQQSGRWHEAQSRLRDLCARYPEDGPSRFHLQRCQQAIGADGQPAGGMLDPYFAAAGTKFGFAAPSTET